MGKKVRLSKMEELKQKLEGPKAPQKAKPKKATKTLAKKKVIGPAHAHKEEAPIPAASKEQEDYIPRGQRADFLKTTITISAEMLTELRALGMSRKAAKQKDTDTSALIREALTDFLRKHRT